MTPFLVGRCFTRSVCLQTKQPLTFFIHKRLGLLNLFHVWPALQPKLAELGPFLSYGLILWQAANPWYFLGVYIASSSFYTSPLSLQLIYANSVDFSLSDSLLAIWFVNCWAVLGMRFRRAIWIVGISVAVISRSLRNLSLWKQGSTCFWSDISLVANFRNTFP